MKKLITADEFAELAHTSPATVRYWVHIGYGPPSAKLGRRRVWREQEVLDWIDRQFETGTAS